LGLGYEDLKKANPKLIYCSLTAFGQTGPDSNLPGYDITTQARSGLMHTSGSEGEPAQVGSGGHTDYISALNATIAILAALRHRDRTGVGQQLDIAMLDCVAAEVGPRNYKQETRGYGKIKCKDGYIVAGILRDMYPKMCRLMGREDLAEKFTGPSYYFFTDEEWEPYEKSLAKWLSERTCEEAIKELSEKQIAAVPIQNLDQVRKDQQLISRNMFIDFYPSSKREIKLEMLGSQFKMSETPVEIEGSYEPALGENTEEILTSLLDYKEEEVAKLVEEGILE
jgi:crotonobetainyl-CoA:carnitine CoA-transferase CaiB-like acyl-CoA transferase